MKNAALALLLALPAAAQNRAAEIDFQNSLQDAQKAAEEAKDAVVVDRTLVDMADGNAMGELIVGALRANGGTVARHPSKDPVTIVFAGGRIMIFLSDSLPAYPRVLGPLIAQAVADYLLYRDMPVSGERSYMVRGAAARVWVELGGTKADFPVIEPLTKAKVPAVSDIIAPWMTVNGEAALHAAAAADKTVMLNVLAENAKSPAEREAIAAAENAFVQFVIAEKPIRRQAGLR